MNNHINAIYDIEKIIVVSGKLKGYLHDLVDYNNMNLDQFTDSIVESKEIVIENNNPLFNKIKQSIIEKIIGIQGHNFKYATSMREKECCFISSFTNANISRMFFHFSNTTGYYLVYEN